MPTQVEHLKVIHSVRSLLTWIYETNGKKFAKDKHSSLFLPTVSAGDIVMFNFIQNEVK